MHFPQAHQRGTYKVSQALAFSFFSDRFPQNGPSGFLRLLYSTSTAKVLSIDYGDGVVEDFTVTDSFITSRTEVTHVYADGLVKLRTVKVFTDNPEDVEKLEFRNTGLYGLLPDISVFFNLRELVVYGTSVSGDSNGLLGIPDSFYANSTLEDIEFHFAFLSSAPEYDRIPTQFFATNLVDLIYGGGSGSDFSDPNKNNFGLLPLLSSTLRTFGSNYSGIGVASFGGVDLSYLTGLSLLGFSGSDVDVSSLVYPNLEVLTLQNSSLGGVGGYWLTIPETSQIRTLTIYGSQNFEGLGIEHLERASELQSLNFGHPSASVALFSTQAELLSAMLDLMSTIEAFSGYLPTDVLRGVSLNVTGPKLVVAVVAPPGYVQDSDNGDYTSLGEVFYILINNYEYLISYTT